MKSPLALFLTFLSVSALPVPLSTVRPDPKPVAIPTEWETVETLIQVPGLIVNSTCPTVQTVNFTAVDAKPWPLVAGQNANFYLNGTSTATIFPGSTLEVAVGLVTENNTVLTIYNDSFDGCSLLKQGLGYQCPVAPGDFYIPLSLAIPESPLPNITLVLQALAFNGDAFHSPIGCLVAVLSLGDLPIIPASNTTLPVSNANTIPINIDLSSMLA